MISRGVRRPSGQGAKAFHKASVAHGFRSRLALHAWKIRFAHPRLGVPVEVVAPLPPELALPEVA